jgi:hypothetical protein
MWPFGILAAANEIMKRVSLFGVLLGNRVSRVNTDLRITAFVEPTQAFAYSPIKIDTNYRACTFIISDISGTCIHYLF